MVIRRLSADGRAARTTHQTSSSTFVRNLIASTTTRTVYQKSIKVSDEQMSALSIVHEDFHPRWNCMTQPRQILDLAAA